jgi:hypothetical protein
MVEYTHRYATLRLRSTTFIRNIFVTFNYYEIQGKAILDC